MVASLVMLGMSAALPAQAADIPQSVGAIKKSNDLNGKPLIPGQEFKYEIVLTCLGIHAECVNFTVTDQLPAGLEITSLPPTTDTQIVTYDAATGLLTVEFKIPLQNPSTEVGLPAGSPVSFEIGMRLPVDSELLEGDIVSNTAVATGDNFPDVESTTDVTVSVPKVITPVATKSWSDGSAVAGTGEASTITLGVRNQSTSSAEVTSLTVIDESEATFEHFNFTSAAVETFPKGADTATLRVKTAAGWVNGGTLTEAGTFTLPAGVSPEDVIGTDVTFTHSSGSTLPYDATGGTVQLGMELRETLRSTGAAIQPDSKLTIDNCAAPAASEADGEPVAGVAVCASYQILPDTVIVTGTKGFFADANGDWAHQNGEHAVVGEPSGVTATIDVKNGSPFPVEEITIIEPDPNGSSEMDKVDLETVRFRPPAGATAVTLTVGYSNGEPLVKTYTVAELEAQGGIENIVRAGSDVTQVKVTYTGVDADGKPSIAENATAGLDLHGKLNDKVTQDDVTDGVANCAAFSISDGREGGEEGQGSASGEACKSLDIELPRTTGEGVKTVGQTSVPEGQPIPFALTVKNNGNKAMTNPVITDPPMNADGTLMDGYANPFEQLKLTEASVSKAATVPNVNIELFVDGAWVPYVAGNATLLESAKGIRALMAGSLLPTAEFTLNLVTERRPGIAEPVEILNCFSTGANGDYTTGDPACAPAITTGPANSSAALNKNIEPGTLPEFVPGLPTQFADVSLSIRNTGNLSAKTLAITDADQDFFDAVNFSKIKSVKFPKGADRVQIDVLTAGGWVDGTPSNQGAIPTSVNAADVLGVRTTFSSTKTSNNGFVITPCWDVADAADKDCIGTVVYEVSPRQTLRSNPDTKVPVQLKNTATGQYLTGLQEEGPADIGKEVEATLELTKGSSGLSVEKTPNTVVSPGQKAPFYLKVTNTGTGNLTGLSVKDLLPPGIGFDETFVGDNGLPFIIKDVQLPADTPELPTPVFTPTTTGERISALSWDFSKNADGSDFLFAPGSTFVIEIRASLEPGSSAGAVLKNTMGATSTNPDLVCTGTEDSQDLFGEGTYCIDSAELTVKAGAFFQSRKWVAGTPSLGWYNSLTKLAVAVGGEAAPPPRMR